MSENWIKIAQAAGKEGKEAALEPVGQQLKGAGDVC